MYTFQKDLIPLTIRILLLCNHCGSALQSIKPTGLAAVRLQCAKAADSDSVVCMSSAGRCWVLKGTTETNAGYGPFPGLCQAEPTVLFWSEMIVNLDLFLAFRSIFPRSMASPSSTPATLMTWWLRSVWFPMAAGWSTSPAEAPWPAGRPCMPSKAPAGFL